MTTRVLGVAAAGILTGTIDGEDAIQRQVRWMSVLRSVSALQMYQRSDHGPIDGVGVVRFLLYRPSFPRSVQFCLDEIRSLASSLPRSDDVLGALDIVEKELAGADPGHVDAEKLDRSMDRVQLAIAGLHDAFQAAYVTHAG